MTDLAIDPGVDDGLVRRLRKNVADELTERSSASALGDGRRLDRDDQRALARHLINGRLEALARERLAQGRPALSEAAEESLARAVFDRLFAFGLLQPLLDDESIINIVANGCDQVFIEYADGTKAPGPRIAASDGELIEILRDIGRRYGLSERQFNPAKPSLNLQLPDGSRLFAVAWVCDRPGLAVRRHRLMRVSLDDLVRLGALDIPGQELFLRLPCAHHLRNSGWTTA